MDRDGTDGYTLSTGRRIYAHGLSLGLTYEPMAGVDVLVCGYDGTCAEDQPACAGADQLAPQLTAPERQEIARFMSARWEDWASLVGVRMEFGRRGDSMEFYAFFADDSSTKAVRDIRGLTIDQAESVVASVRDEVFRPGSSGELTCTDCGWTGGMSDCHACEPGVSNDG